MRRAGISWEEGGAALGIKLLPTCCCSVLPWRVLDNEHIVERRRRNDTNRR